MSDATSTLKIRLPRAASRSSGIAEPLVLPAVLVSGVRSGDLIADPFLGKTITVEQSIPLAAPSRSDVALTTAEISDRRLLALEASDGTTVFVRADKLSEDVARVAPAAFEEGTLNLSLFHDRDAVSRGAGDWLWSRLTVLELHPDALLDVAREQALAWAREWLGDKLQEQFEQLAAPSASWLGAKALMWAIESRLAGEPGIYQWRGGELALSDRCAADDPRLLSAVAEGPILLFIHGTASHTLGSFKDLRETGAMGDWEAIGSAFGDRVFGFEHRTFSESPIDNALQLAQALPANARLCLVTHSRGGLVGDLICAVGLSEASIRDYRRDAPPNVKESALERKLRLKVLADEQAKLRTLRDVLREKNFIIERYARVACPARGTTLLSDNLDVFLGGLLSLTVKLVGSVAGPGGSLLLSAFKRIVLEIADKRIDPRLVPGIEAMLTDAPLTTLLARTPRPPNTAMAVIAGDVEGGSLLKRLGVLFTDWMFFDQVDNDLVVDTESMYAGLAMGDGAHYLFDQGETTNHFSYFSNRRTRAALRDWLTADRPQSLPGFTELARRAEPPRVIVQRGDAAPPLDSRPVVILLPGIMGSHLEVRGKELDVGDGDRVWFDFLGLVTGDLKKIGVDAADVCEEALFEMFYGDLAEHLEQSHTVIRFPYDWRLPIQDPRVAGRLAETVERALRENPSQPVRILAHSMGGLVTRAMIAQRPDVWDAVAQRPGGRFVMLGTPNNGSHLMVETLLGKSGTIRKLARIDVSHDLGEVLSIVSEFCGAVQLLPRPGFQDSANLQREDYYTRKLWSELRGRNKDRWFGDGIAGIAKEQTYATANALWKDLLAPAGQTRHIAHEERIAYVFGQAENTPCGVTEEAGRLKMVGTPEGDGSVSWTSGRLPFLPEQCYWYMPVDHGALADTEEYFPAIVELLQLGETQRLGRLPKSRGVAAAVRKYDAAPPVLPTEEEMARSLLGGRPKRRRPAVAVRPLRISVHAMDLRFAQQPVMCGHYSGDAISGAERRIDECLVGGALTQRNRLGVYAGELGSSVTVLQPRSDEDKLRGTGRGAVVVGLGEFGQLSAEDVTQAVRSGVLRFLLNSYDRDGGTRASSNEHMELTLASVLIGYNSTVHISVDDSMAAIVRGVLEANKQFGEAMPRARLHIGELQFLELFQDTAISAAHALTVLPQRLANDLRRIDARIEVAHQLTEREGARPRLSVFAPFGYWPRMIVTDADRGDDRVDTPLPREVLRDVMEREFGVSLQNESVTQIKAATRPDLAQRLKYVFLSERARAESVVQQRQPGLIEALVKNAIHHSTYNADLSRTLFQLMVPIDFKAAARETEQLVLVVDGYTANLPWEMLQAEDQPMALKTAVVRQLASTRFRRTPRSTTQRNACIIANPLTNGYYTHFGNRQTVAPRETEDHLPELSGAGQEGAAIRNVLTECKYSVTHSERAEALDVFSQLFRPPGYRIVMIAAHGVFEAVGKDGKARTGVVLSDGMLLTAAEISEMEVVPELVFLNCCHLGTLSATSSAANRLAYSLARELIEIGVRCVVAAGWQVDDDAARVFSEVFFEQFVKERRAFGLAIHAARKATWAAHPRCNTWGAYQAYGDPGFVLEPGQDASDGEVRRVVAAVELLAELERIRVSAHHQKLELKAVHKRINSLLQAVPLHWQERMDVQAAVGAVYAELGTEAFELARTAYQHAIADFDKYGRVPAKAIEQLAELEARTGEHLGSEAGLELIDRAISRLAALLAVTAASQIEGPTNVLRKSMLLSATMKRELLRARLHPKKGVWKDVAKVMRQAQKELYGDSPEAIPLLPPYAIINWLHLEAVLGTDKPEDCKRLAQNCQVAARKRFLSSQDFFDAIMPADAEVAILLVDGNLVERRDALLATYNDCARRVAVTRRQFESVTSRLRMLSAFLVLRAGPGDADRAAALGELANNIEPVAV